MSEFVGEEVQVRCEGQVPRPAEVLWRGRSYKVSAILAAWHDSGFAPGAPKKRTWRLRRHRNYYHVKVESGEICEPYLDRAAKDRHVWVLSQVVFRPPSARPTARDGQT